MIILRNHDDGSMVRLDADPDMFEMVVGMMVDELNDVHPDSAFELVEYNRADL
jgi:hypothetical protein